MYSYRKYKWLAIFVVFTMILGFLPAMAGAVAHDPVPNYAFIPNSGEASVSKVDLVSKVEVARYYTEDRTGPNAYDWRTSRIAMDSEGNAWVLNVGADGTGLQGSVVRIQADTSGLTTTATDATPLPFGTDDAVELFNVGSTGEMPRAIAIDADGYIWIGFYSGGYLAKYSFDGTDLTLEDTFRLGEGTANNIKFYEMKFDPDGVLWISSRSSTPTRSGVQGVYSFDGTVFTLEWATNPYALLIDPISGEVFATSYSNVIWRSSTGLATVIPGATNLRGMAFDEDGVIWIANTSGGSGGNKVFSFDPSTDTAGAVYTLTVGNTPVGVGRDEAGLMWAICRTDNSPSGGYIEAFDPSGASPVFAGSVKVGFRPYAYGDFIVPPPPEYEIAGYKYNDDTGLEIEGWNIDLLKKNPDTLAYEFFATTTTGPDGKYSFPGLLAGDYRVVEEQLEDWTAVGDTYHNVTLPGGETLYPVDGDAGPFYNFRNALLYEIEGFKYRTGTDIPLGGWTIELRKVGDTEFFQTRVTDINGYYKFTGLRAGDYEVTEVQKTGWTQTGPEFGVHLVTLPGEIAELTYDFYNEPEMNCYDDTIWAYAGDEASWMTNNSVPGNSSNNWGWTNQITDPGEYEFVLYRGAGGNDIEKGTAVGTLFVDYDGVEATITYSVVEPYTLSEVHLWVGATPLPEQTVTRGKTTTTVVSSAPGQLAKLGYSPEISADGLTATITVENLESPFWVAAHGVVDWCEMVAAEDTTHYHWGVNYAYSATPEVNAVAVVTSYGMEVWFLYDGVWYHDIYVTVDTSGFAPYAVDGLAEPVQMLHKKHFPGMVTTYYNRNVISVGDVPVPNAMSIFIP